MLILGETEVERRREKGQQPDRTLELLAEMQGLGHETDVVTCTRQSAHA